MAEQGPTGEMNKAWAFFEKARKAAETGNFDYAIDMFLEGLRIEPEAISDGHMKLHALAMQRKEKGGKGPSMMEKVKALRPHRGQGTLEQLINAEHLFTKDPDHLPYAESMLKAAVQGGYKQTALWIADILFQANNNSGKPSMSIYILLKNSYSAIGQYDRALAACQYAVKIKPQDGELADEFRRLSAELTMARGKYDQEGDFRKSIKDREVQEKRQSQESIIKTEDYRIEAIEDARKELAREPGVPGYIFNLAQALSDMDEEKFENEAIELLEETYADKKDFSFKDRAGQIRLKQLTRKLRQAKTALEANPAEAAAKAAVEQADKQFTDFKREHYRLCVVNYPTDLHVKYEYANCLLQNKQYDEAIPVFQEASRDPRHKISALGRIGLCFYLKGWYADAIDVFNQAIEEYELTDDSTAKELRYNLGRAYEAKGDTEKALEIYRRIAQLDFGYKDVRQRVDSLRKKQQGGQTPPQS
jgi:tetratricopeptide (TPR) repeat protein